MTQLPEAEEEVEVQHPMDAKGPAAVEAVQLQLGSVSREEEARWRQRGLACQGAAAVEERAHSNLDEDREAGAGEQLHPVSWEPLEQMTTEGVEAVEEPAALQQQPERVYREEEVHLCWATMVLLRWELEEDLWVELDERMQEAEEEEEQLQTAEEVHEKAHWHLVSQEACPTKS